MPRVNPEILTWARETAGLSLADAVQRLGINEARGIAAVDRLASIEAGEREPSRSLLVRMAKQYRRPLVTFYMSAPPRKGDRGEDFRNLPDRLRDTHGLVDALVRDIGARQNTVRAVLADEEEAEPLPFVASMSMRDGVGAVLSSIRRTIKLDLAEFRAQASPESAFALLRSRVEAAGVFVLLIGNLGSHHTAIDVETFRGFALSDNIAPFVVLNDQDARSAWSFTLVHELAHLWLGATGVSGGFAEAQIETFCNDVASGFLLPANELALVQVDRKTDDDTAAKRIGDFARERHLSASMVAYNLFRADIITEATWRTVSALFLAQWRKSRDAQRERQNDSTGPDYYVVRRHRLGSALLNFVSRNMSDGALTPTKAGQVLGVKPRSVAPLLNVAGLPGRAA
ncbi:XRE family transcriptional regulator [Bradyrhizobium sp. CB1015]|uniref:XRE family transcriptional regulator n=1 Tax=Bradyrhizobium sp. CB1015 TaxID=2976822 RepID=UPI0021A9D5A4|nr:XRE family transcriptional regulator [Bradyrhizobium sp. CB1015]UWU91711.1 XRE family transcriptional regulator [Bradyrhizobium sp. CB1015]